MRRDGDGTTVFGAALEAAVISARDRLLSQQRNDGHWCYEFEADCTIPAEYVLMMHYMDEIDLDLEQRIARYLRRRQQPDGGWPLYHDASLDVSCTVKCYYALKLAGDDPEAPHMRRAREALLARGGAARANVFTRIMLAQFRQIPWHAIPFMPVELILAPRWLPFHLTKISYWSRTVMVPLLVLVSLRRHARNPRGVGIRELFTTPPEKEREWFAVRSSLNRAFLWCERVARLAEPLVPWGVRRHALARCESWIVARMNGEGGLGAIFPAMVNAYETLDALGYAPAHPMRQTAKRALESLLVVKNGEAYCQPCLSPVWDTALATLALQEAGGGATAVRRALDWLAARQLVNAPGDWQESRQGLAGGGWPFQYSNDHYPDLDDTSAVAWAMHNARSEAFAECIERAAAWIVGMQSRSGGFASFDADNTREYLNEIPFADHGALLDPPTADVTARCVTLLTQLDGRYRKACERAIDFLSRAQHPCGSWWGRWGTNYLYGTWSVLTALEAAGIAREDPRVRRAVEWLKSVQHADGSFGETNDSYEDPRLAGKGPASPEQTAWGLLALMAAGEVESDAVWRGIEWLLAALGEDGVWHSDASNAPGFPTVFYLRYHGYSVYFPLWALARYRNLTRG